MPQMPSIKLRRREFYPRATLDRDLGPVALQCLARQAGAGQALGSVVEVARLKARWP